MPRVQRLFLLFLLMTTCGLAYSQVQYTLKQCVDSALQNNLQVRQGEVQLSTAQINNKQARNNQLPDLFANLNHGINQGRSIDPFTNTYINQAITYGNYNLSSDLLLFNGLQLRNLVRQTGLDQQATQMDLQTIRDNLTLNVILAYLQVLSSEEQVAQSRSQQLLTQKQVDRLTTLNDQGAIVPQQLYELKGQLATDQLALINNENAAQSAKLTLSQIMNIPYDKSMELEKLMGDDLIANSAADPNDIYHLALSLAPVKAALLRTQSATQALRVARGQFYPSVSLSGNLYTNYSSVATKDVFVNSTQSPSGDFVEVGGSPLPVISTIDHYDTQKIGYGNQFSNNYNTSINLNLRIPILNGFRARNNVALAKNQLKTAQYTVQTTELQLRQSIDQASLNRDAAYRKYVTLQQQVADFTEAFRIAEVRFEKGVSNQVEYLIAINNLDRSKSGLIDAKYDFIFRNKILDYYQGKLSL